MTKAHFSQISSLLTGIFFLTCLFFNANAGIDPDDPSVKRYTISGHIKDNTSGEDLFGSSVLVTELNTGTIANEYGFYSVSLTKGIYTLRFSYMGYETQTHKITADKDIVLDINLNPSSAVLNEVEIRAERGDANIKTPEMSVVKLDVKTINRIPALMGEVDIIKAIQLLPGVQSVSEGSSGFSVRGGSPDQNLVLLDEATVYNPSHFLGFFSVFNNDAIKDVKLYKGDIPAQYGGRLASVLDVRMKDGNQKKFSGTGGIGLISSRLTLEGPIIKDKTSFILSGRRTYADLFLPLSKNEGVQDSRLYFYDFNAKINHTFNENNRLYLSGYFGNDIFKNPFAYMKLGNTTATIRWNHLFSKRLFSNFTAIYSRYQYGLGTADDNNPNSFLWTSVLQDYQVKGDFTYYPGTNHTLRFGLTSSLHLLDPGSASGRGDSSLFTEYSIDRNHSLESGLYVSNDQLIGSRLTLKYGLRFSLFQNIGPSTVFLYDDEFHLSDSAKYENSKFYNTYTGLEPRLGLTYVLDEFSSVKASYTHTYQYLQLAQNSTAGTPLDVWYSASPNVKPQISDQAAIGYFRNFRKNTIETSVEVYYKTMRNTIDLKDHAELLLNKQLEGELRFGKGWSYGVELMVSKPQGKINGWVSYTFSRTWRKFEDINDGKKYPAPYDSPHDVSIVLNYDATKRISISANWIYSTGKPVTFPTGRAVIDGVVVPIYSDRNAYRMMDYHRLDLSVALHKKPSDSRFDWDLVFSVYNAYNRHNTWAINFVQDDLYPLTTYAEQTYLFGIIPAVTFNFQF
ncbi:MAG: TonB-dependent receptor [Bacteroidales bacterium]|nr:TonB-dependent receptor [Bacteroidales bacterium]